MNLNVMQDGSEQIRYQDPGISIYIRHGDLLHLTNMAAVCHWHADVELLLVCSGYLHYSVNGQIFRVEEGNAIFVAPRQLHYGFSADGSDCRYICLCFKPELLAVHPGMYESFVEPIAGNMGTACILIESGKPGHDRILHAIRSIDAQKNCDMALIGKLFELWQGLYDISKPDRTLPPDRVLESLKQMAGFIRGNYSEQITLPQIAAAGGVCRSSCCQIFKKYMGSSPNEYLMSFRLERATQMLQETSLSITEIANACGFNSSSYFAEAFGKQKGCTPTQYRRKYRHGFVSDLPSPTLR